MSFFSQEFLKIISYDRLVARPTSGTDGCVPVSSEIAKRYKTVLPINRTISVFSNSKSGMKITYL